MELIRVLPDELPQGFCMAGMYAGEKRLQMAAYVPHLRVMADERMWNTTRTCSVFTVFRISA